MTRTKWSLSRKLSAVIVMVVLSMAATAVALVLSAAADERARQENCEIVRDAFIRYTDDLAAVVGAEGSPEVVELQRRTAESLEDCS